MHQRRAGLKSASEAILARYGRNSVVTATELLAGVGSKLTERRLRHHLPLDFRYVHGGGPLVQGWHALCGKEHSGKSLSFALLVASIHRHCRNCFRPYRFLEVIDGMDPPRAKLGNGGMWTVQGKKPFAPVVNGETGDYGYVWSWYWRTKSARAAWILTGTEGAWAPRYETVDEKHFGKTSPWEFKEHGVVMETPWCDCALEGYRQPRWIDPECPKGDTFSDKAYDARMAMYGQTGNSYDATTVFLVELENKFKPEWVQTLGVDLARLDVSGFGCAEDAIDVIDAQILAGNYDAIGIDSIEYFEPRAQKEAASGESEDQGRAAKTTNAGMRKWTLSRGQIGRKTGRKPMMVVINQFRVDRKTGRNTLPKGKAQLFAADTRLDFWTADWTKKEQKDGRGGEEHTETEGVRICFRGEKMCSGPAKLQGGFRLRLKPREYAGKVVIPYGGVDDHGMAYRRAKTYGLVGKDNDGRWVCEGSEGTYRTEQDLKVALTKDPAMFDRLISAVLDAMLVEHQKPVSGFN